MSTHTSLEEVRAIIARQIDCSVSEMENARADGVVGKWQLRAACKRYLKAAALARTVDSLTKFVQMYR